ncbi:hypothetical protein JCM10207_007094 [Rhodosporidiobolus poonsookiae]
MTGCSTPNSSTCGTRDSSPERMDIDLTQSSPEPQTTASKGLRLAVFHLRQRQEEEERQPFTRTGFIDSSTNRLRERYDIVAVERPRADGRVELGCAVDNCCFAAIASPDNSGAPDSLLVDFGRSEWSHSHAPTEQQKKLLSGALVLLIPSPRPLKLSQTVFKPRKKQKKKRVVPPLPSDDEQPVSGRGAEVDNRSDNGSGVDPDAADKGGSETEADALEGGAAEDRGTAVRGDPPAQEAVEQLDFPGLPQIGDTFPSATAAYCAFVRATVPVYGVGIQLHSSYAAYSNIRCNRYRLRNGKENCTDCRFGCSFSLDKTTGLWRINSRDYHAVHSHGPNPRIVADPLWRPAVRNVDARRALGMDVPDGPASSNDDSPANVADISSGAEEDSGEPVPRRRRSKAADAKGKGKAKEDEPPSSGRKRRRVISPTPSRSPSPPPIASSSGSRAPPAATVTRKHSPSISAPQLTPSSVSPAPRASSPRLPPARDHPPPLQPTLPNLLSNANDLSADRLRAFLLALHPSLAALAIPLHFAGINSVDALVSLAHLAPDMFDSFVALVDDRTARKRKENGEGDEEAMPMSVFQVKMLAKALREGRQAGWPVE